MAGEITEQETNFSLVADTTLRPVGDGPGLLVEWLGWLTNRLQAISGAENWFDDPGANLKTLSDHLSSDNPHSDSVPTTRKLLAGNGLAGGGDLSTDRSISVARNGITDNHIGNRIINDSSVPASNSGTITELMSGIANMIKTITGEEKWSTSPIVSLRELSADVDTLEFPQITPAEEWIIIHNLKRYPSVSIVDSSGALVFGDVTYISENELHVRFQAPFSGICYLN